MADLKQSMDQMNRKINAFFSFVGNKLKNFKNLTLGEQISYCSIGAGLLLMMVSVVLFVL
ncbi:MAG: hypothetical protein Q7K45_00720 [Nanoarchaeota archaeon]|nr:hypothetical protein [Nanoarchaeota archaeon]